MGVWGSRWADKQLGGRVSSRAIPDHESTYRIPDTGYQPGSEFKIRPDPDTGCRIMISKYV